MEKKIRIIMLPSKEIQVSIEDGSALCVQAEHREIKADDLFKLLDYSRGDKYVIETNNDCGIDVPVFRSFTNLITDIVKVLNQIAESDPDEHLN